jgi:hypothetical protein
MKSAYAPAPFLNSCIYDHLFDPIQGENVVKLTVQRTQNEKVFGKTRTIEFGVTFQLLLLPEERRQVDYYELGSFQITTPTFCEKAPDNVCSVPIYTLAALHGGVKFAPPIGAVPNIPVTVLRVAAMIHAEDDVIRGCERLANTIESLVSHQGEHEFLFEIG